MNTFLWIDLALFVLVAPLYVQLFIVHHMLKSLVRKTAKFVE